MVHPFSRIASSLAKHVCQRVLSTRLARPSVLLLVVGAPAPLVKGLLLLAFAGFASTLAFLLAGARSVHHTVMFVGALCWLVSGLLWSVGSPPPALVPWWLTGFVLIITGERLELSRVFRPSRPVRWWFVVAVLLLTVATALESVVPAFAARTRGLALLLLTAWLLRFDVARRGLRQSGVHRFTAVSLLHGYLWLGAGGLLLLAHGHQRSGFLYDAQVHALALGFVFSQVFARAPIILPAVTGFRYRFTRLAYAAPLLLAPTLLLRLTADLLADAALRRIAGVGNALALALFLVATTVAVALGRRPRFSAPPGSGRLASSAGAGYRSEERDARLPGRYVADR